MVPTVLLRLSFSPSSSDPVAEKPTVKNSGRRKSALSPSSLTAPPSGTRVGGSGYALAKAVLPDFLSIPVDISLSNRSRCLGYISSYHRMDYGGSIDFVVSCVKDLILILRCSFSLTF